MTAAVYTHAYLLEIMAFGAILAILKCGLGMLFSYISSLLTRLTRLKIKLPDKAAFHFTDAVFVLAFSIGYLLLNYINRDGAVRIIDILLIFVFYLIWKYIFGYIFNFLDNILRQIASMVIVKPVSFLHNLLTLVITRIIRAQKSDYK